MKVQWATYLLAAGGLCGAACGSGDGAITVAGVLPFHTLCTTPHLPSCTVASPSCVGKTRFPQSTNLFERTLATLQSKMRQSVAAGGRLVVSVLGDSVGLGEGATSPPGCDADHRAFKFIHVLGGFLREQLVSLGHPLGAGALDLRSRAHGGWKPCMLLACDNDAFPDEDVVIIQTVGFPSPGEALCLEQLTEDNVCRGKAVILLEWRSGMLKDYPDAEIGFKHAALRWNAPLLHFNVFADPSTKEACTSTPSATSYYKGLTPGIAFDESRGDATHPNTVGHRLVGCAIAELFREAWYRQTTMTDRVASGRSHTRCRKHEHGKLLVTSSTCFSPTAVGNREQGIMSPAKGYARYHYSPLKAFDVKENHGFSLKDIKLAYNGVGKKWFEGSVGANITIALPNCTSIWFHHYQMVDGRGQAAIAIDGVSTGVVIDNWFPGHPTLKKGRGFSKMAIVADSLPHAPHTVTFTVLPETHSPNGGTVFQIAAIFGRTVPQLN